MEKKLYSAEEFAADESFIAYYLKTDAAAVAYWENWIALHPEKIDEVQIAENLLDVLYTRLPQHELDAERARLTAFIQTHTPRAAATAAHQPQRYFTLSTLIRVAAAVTIITAVALFFFRRNGNEVKQQAQLSAWTNYTSPRAQQSTIRLSDGTTVTLNAGSTLSYPTSFTGQDRVVSLSGQAFFEVTHDTSHPFIVRTGKIHTRVLGTAFNVRGFKGDQTIAVALIKGSVQIEVQDQQKQVMRLQPGEMMKYSIGAGQLHKSAFDEATEAGWRNGLLVFKHAGFKTIAQAFQRNYGYTLINQSGSEDFEYTGQFNKQTPAQTIKAICFSLNLNYTLKGNTIVLSNP